MSSKSSSPEGPERFPSTAWTFIKHVGEQPPGERVEGLNRFISCYWRPVFCFLRARGNAKHESEDLTQEFFARLIEKDCVWLRNADKELGRFRTFLLKILNRFLSDQGPKRAPRQIGFEKRKISFNAVLSDADKAFDPPVNETPEDIFMKEWAKTMLHGVLHRLRQYYQEEGQGNLYDIFATRNFSDEAKRGASQAELGQKHGMSRDQIRYALKKVKEQFITILHDELRDQVSSPQDLEEEIRDLLVLLKKNKA